MLTVHPSIMLGSYLLDEARLPGDEFEIRMEPLRAAMRERSLAAMLVYGDAREHQALAFFSNFIPRMRWAMAMFPAQGAPRLLASMSSRDMPAMRTMTWVGDVKSGWEWKWFEEFAESLGASGRIGTIGFDEMTPLLNGQMQKTIAGKFELVACDDVAVASRAGQRPRELAILRSAADLAGAAAEEIAVRWRAGDDVERAALAGERLARAGAAQDVRTLVSRDGGPTLEPYAARFDDRPEKLLAYVAVKHLGYWSESFVSLGSPEAARRRTQRGMDVLIEGLRAGASVAELARRTGEVAGEQHPAFRISWGHRIGLAPHEGHDLKADSHETIEAGSTYALRVGDVSGAVSSAMVMLKANGEQAVVLRRDAEG
jgi:Xaa-Pro aminopeptidase